jgi:uncharacterized oligopeptide transporter (OPT) family protein
MLIVGFFFATVSGNLVGMIGSSNNPISGLTLSTLIIAALLMVALGIKGTRRSRRGARGGCCGVRFVRGRRRALAGLQGWLHSRRNAAHHSMVELVAVVLSSLVMYFPLYVLHVANIKGGGTGFGDPKLPAPQAGLMASLAQGIVGGEMAWPLVVTGMFFGVALIMLRVRSPMWSPSECTCRSRPPSRFSSAACCVGARHAQQARRAQRSPANARREHRHPDRQRFDRW